MLHSYQNQVTLDTEKSDLPAQDAPVAALAESPAVDSPADGDASPETPDSSAPAIEEVPILPVRDTVLFPHGLLPISVGRPASVALVKSLGENRSIGIVSQLDARADSPAPAELYGIGTLVVIHKIVPMREGLLLFCEGVSRLRTIEFVSTEPYLKARIERIPELEPEITPQLEALRQNVLSAFQQIVSAAPNLSDEIYSTASNIPEIGRLADFVASALPGMTHVERQTVLEQLDARSRLEYMNVLLAREVELAELRSKIQSQVQGQLSQSQREFYLREQVKAIQKELGESDDTQQDVEELKASLEAAGMSDEVKAEAMKELKRLSRISPMSPEYTVTRTYLEWMANLPWNKSTGEAVNVAHAAEILDEDHYDLEKVKNRILDYLAVLQLKPGHEGTDPVLRRTSGRGQDFARPVDRPLAGPEVLPHLDGRHA